eukprot:2113292-Pyramimonas_sp.AAC.1
MYVYMCGCWANRTVTVGVVARHLRRRSGADGEQVEGEDVLLACEERPPLMGQVLAKQQCLWRHAPSPVSSTERLKR